jgi:hypothetical protein
MAGHVASSCTGLARGQGSAVHAATQRAISLPSRRGAIAVHAASANSRVTQGIVAAVSAVALLAAVEVGPAQADLNKFEAAVSTSG